MWLLRREARGQTSRPASRHCLKFCKVIPTCRRLNRSLCAEMDAVETAAGCVQAPPDLPEQLSHTFRNAGTSFHFSLMSLMGCVRRSGSLCRASCSSSSSPLGWLLESEAGIAPERRSEGEQQIQANPVVRLRSRHVAYVLMLRGPGHLRCRRRPCHAPIPDLDQHSARKITQDVQYSACDKVVNTARSAEWVEHGRRWPSKPARQLHPPARCFQPKSHQHACTQHRLGAR